MLPSSHSSNIPPKPSIAPIHSTPQTLPIAAPPNIPDPSQISRMNWHGKSLKFSNHYIDRQSKDLGLFRSSKLNAIKAAQEYENFLQKKHLQEYDHDQKLLGIKKKKEKSKHLRLLTLLANNTSLENAMHEAAIFIQKHVRGFLVRNEYKEELMEIERRKLAGKIQVLENSVEKCIRYIGETGRTAATILQKNVRTFLAVRKFTKIKQLAYELREQTKLKGLILIQAHVRRFLARKIFRGLLIEAKLKFALEKIRKKLLVLRLKNFWHRKKFVWETIRKKYAEKTPESSFTESNHEIASLYQVSFELMRSNSKRGSRTESRFTSKRNTIVLKEQVVPSVAQAKPPKAPPQQLKLTYLQSTESYRNRTLNDTPDSKTTPVHRRRSISGQRFQQNTNSRLIYIKEVQNESNRSNRAVSADYRKRNINVSVNAVSQHEINELISVYREVPGKSPLPNLLLKKLDEAPKLVTEDAIEKVYVYNAPKPQSLSFRDALPDVSTLLETYARNIRNQK